MAINVVTKRQKLRDEALITHPAIDFLKGAPVLARWKSDKNVISDATGKVSSWGVSDGNTQYNASQVSSTLQPTTLLDAAGKPYILADGLQSLDFAANLVTKGHCVLFIGNAVKTGASAPNIANGVYSSPVYSLYNNYHIGMAIDYQRAGVEVDNRVSNYVIATSQPQAESPSLFAFNSTGTYLSTGRQGDFYVYNLGVSTTAPMFEWVSSALRQYTIQPLYKIGGRNKGCGLAIYEVMIANSSDFAVLYGLAQKQFDALYQI